MKRSILLRACVGAGATAFALAAGAFAPLPAYPQDAPPAETVPTTAEVGRLAPDIQVGEWIGGDGRTSLADFRGEVVFLEFWGTH